MRLSTAISGMQLAIRASVLAALSVAIAQVFMLEYPIYAFLAAVIVTDLKPSQSRGLGLRRLVATVVGTICGAAFSPALPPGPWSIGLSVLLAMVIRQLLQAREGAKVADYICGIVVLDHNAEPWLYAFFRLIETALGISVAWSISCLPKLIRINEVEGHGTRA